jgi:hypothetical protein
LATRTCAELSGVFGRASAVRTTSPLELHVRVGTQLGARCSEERAVAGVLGLRDSTSRFGDPVMFDQMHAAATTLAAYMSPVRFSSRHCALVARLLAAHAPSGLTDDQKRALDRVLARADAVDAVRKERQRVSAPALREPRNAMITAWSALYGALQAVAAVPRELSPAPAEAEALAWTLFPNGIGLASVDAAGLWSLSRMLLERIEEEGLRPRLAAIVNPVNLLAVEAAFATLGIAVGAEGPLVRLPAKRALFEATAAFSYAVAAYARTLAIGVDETEPEDLERFRAALASVDTYKIVGRSRAGLSEEDLEERDERDSEPETPDPDAPYVPASDDPIDNPFVTT